MVRARYRTAGRETGAEGVILAVMPIKTLEAK
jgi:hypothetical protein